MSQRSEFIEQAQAEGTNLSALCRAYGISRKTAYKWLKRVQTSGAAGLEDQSRRPKHSPEQTGSEIVERVLALRAAHPVWGGRKIRKVLEREGCIALPAASTITAILQRSGQIDPAETRKRQTFQRFERAAPNELWQMDFKGHFRLGSGGECHPLTVIDDHSRFLVGLKACPNETFQTVQTQLTAIFRQHGLPEGMLMDNGSPWGDDWESRHTILTVWLLRLQIQVAHGRPYHPQTQGKDERFNRTLKEEVINAYPLQDLKDSQGIFDEWLQVYNCQRPHEALQLDTPASRYLPSPRPFPEVLPPICYDGKDPVRQVDVNGKISFHHRRFRVGKAFRDQPVAVRALPQEGLFAVFFCQLQIAQINLCDDPVEC